ncbi:GAF domain-containing sensor histidine kinase [Saccharopolyspora erythraea]|uniref:GAF domain-containing sensor histidine kinase n=1 Tax=Saccharopolyspora erythraea TaxID=1836 RepID=UPI001E3C1FAB|nr:ATP-binding protein [Saccharopolyspora erythraea]
MVETSGVEVGQGHRASEERAAEQGVRFDELLDEHSQVLNLLDDTVALRGLAQRIRHECGAHIGLAGPVESEQLLVLRQWNGTWADGLHDLHVPMGLGLGGLSFAELRPVWVDDYCASELITHDFDRPISADGIRTMLAVPMVRAGRVHGVVYAAMREITDFGGRRLDAAVNVANSGGLALQTADAARRQRETAAAAERRRIASALHDSVGAQLFRIGAELRDLRTHAEDGSTALLDRLVSLENQIAETASAFRESVHALDHDEPSGGLAATLSGDCAAFQRRTGVTAQAVEIGTTPDCGPHRTRVLVAAAREALLNVEKHAAAHSVLISVIALDDGVTVSVADDGNGWNDHAAAGNGIGLRSTADRVEEVGGTMSVVTNEDGGLTVRIWVPLW